MPVTRASAAVPLLWAGLHPSTALAHGREELAVRRSLVGAVALVAVAEAERGAAETDQRRADLEPAAASRASWIAMLPRLDVAERRGLAPAFACLGARRGGGAVTGRRPLVTLRIAEHRTVVADYGRAFRRVPGLGFEDWR